MSPSVILLGFCIAEKSKKGQKKAINLKTCRNQVNKKLAPNAKNIAANSCNIKKVNAYLTTLNKKVNSKINQKILLKKLEDTIKKDAWKTKTIGQPAI